MLEKKFDSQIVLDDFSKREYYHLLNNYFHIKLYGRMGYLIRKDFIDLNRLKKDIMKYTNDYR